MSIQFDITQEFQELKSSFTCQACKNLLKQPVILKTCSHVVCRDCVKEKLLKCPVCSSPHFERDVEEDEFSESVAAIISNIEQIFNSSPSQCECDDPNSPANQSKCDDPDGFQIVMVETVMKRNPKGETPLHLACKKGNIKKIQELLDKVVDVNMTDYANWTALHEAVESDSSNCCRILLKSGALTDVPGEFYTTPLHKAVTLNNVEIVELLLTYGASKEAMDYFGKKAMDLVVSEDMANILQNKLSMQVTKPKIFLNPFPVIFCENISREYKEKMLKAKAKFITTQDFIKRDDITHLVLGNSDKLDVRILIAIIKGVFIVDKQWIENYSNVEDIATFTYISNTYRDTVMKSVENRWLQRPKLFDGISFHIVDHEKPERIHGVKITKQDLICLIEQGGGKHVIRPPALRTVEGNCYFPYHVDRSSELTMCCNYIICIESKLPELLYNMKELRHKTSKWLIDCILKFQIVD